MCYDVAYQTKRSLEYAKKRSKDPKVIEELEEKWKKVEHILPVRYHTSGFEHLPLPVFADAAPLLPKAFLWGLIPPWVKDAKQARQLSNKTLNARAETIFEKPAFRLAAKHSRCLIMIDHFYEHYHLKGKTYPHLIRMQNQEPMVLGGLWSEWLDPDSEKKIRSVSIVTTPANELMRKIHNNPKVKEARMPLILADDLQDEWLMEVEEPSDEELIKELCQPYPDHEMEAYPVGSLRGKNAAGNTAQSMEKKDYLELNQQELF